MSTTLDILAIGAMACRLRCSLQDIERAASELGIEPALILNGTPHYQTSDFDRIDERIGRYRSEK